jgi:hypothetical protein
MALAGRVRAAPRQVAPRGALNQGAHPPRRLAGPAMGGLGPPDLPNEWPRYAQNYPAGASAGTRSVKPRRAVSVGASRLVDTEWRGPEVGPRTLRPAGVWVLLDPGHDRCAHTAECGFGQFRQSSHATCHCLPSRIVGTTQQNRSHRVLTSRCRTAASRIQGSAAAGKGHALQ